MKETLANLCQFSQAGGNLSYQLIDSYRWVFFEGTFCLAVANFTDRNQTNRKLAHFGESNLKTTRPYAKSRTPSEHPNPH